MVRPVGGLMQCPKFKIQEHQGVTVITKRRYKLQRKITICSGGSRISRSGGGGGRGPPMQVLFTEIVCKIKRIGSCRGDMHQACPLDPPMICLIKRNMSLSPSHLQGRDVVLLASPYHSQSMV